MPALALTIQVLLFLAAGSSSQPASQPATRPASAPAEVSLLTDAAARAWRARLGESFIVLAEPPFVVAGNLPAEQIRTYAEASVLRPVRAMQAGYFAAPPDKVITVLLFKDEATYRDSAARLLGDAEVPHFGYYRHADRTLVMNIATGTGTLVHELTHALIAFDWPAVPLWFNEGLASLHEQCQVRPEELIGLPNWRLPALQEAIRQGRLGSLAELVAADFYGADRGLNYAQARYFCQYLQHRGLLSRFYRDYRAARDAPAVQTIESVCGQTIAEVDQDMRRWVLTLRWQ